MLGELKDGFSRGMGKIRNHPQLFYTILVSVVIFFAFIFMAGQFVKIAADAQERLVNVRIGSIHDTFSAFARNDSFDRKKAGEILSQIASQNATLKDLYIAEKKGRGYTIVSAAAPERVGKQDAEHAFLFNLALADPSHSFTFPAEDNNGRYFLTVRALPPEFEDAAPRVLFSRQTLSEADQAIRDSVRNSLIALVVVLAFVMLLFWRHSKIVDYAVLYRKLKEVDEMKDSFIAMASHELRTPLSVIRGYAEMLGENRDEEERKQFAGKIETATAELDDLVGDILDVSRIEQGRLSYALEAVNPGEIIHDAAEKLRRSAHEKGLKIEVESSQTPVCISVDPNRFRQVLMNLVGNAVKYTETGKITVSLYQEEKDVKIRVSDTGIGMSEKEREKLFEKFYRVKNKDTSLIRGTGLGLWITKKITEEMYGSLSVESIKGVGTHMVISFPAVIPGVNKK